MPCSNLEFASGCRRSELVGLDVGDMSFGDDGIEVTIRWSKTDQEGLGRKMRIPYGGRPRTCPVRAVRDWIDFAYLSRARSSVPSIVSARSCPLD